MSSSAVLDMQLGLAGLMATYLEFQQAMSQAMINPLEGLLNGTRSARPHMPVGGSARYAALLARCWDLSKKEATGGIIGALLDVQATLPWVYHYAPRNADEDLAGRIAFAEFIGPDGPLWAPACRIGFTVMAEQTSYPLHAHPAVELYLVIAGRARWTTPRSDRVVPPGDLILHASGEPHAMRTFEEPLLALWGWSGEIDAPAAYI